MKREVEERGGGEKEKENKKKERKKRKRIPLLVCFFSFVFLASKCSNRRRNLVRLGSRETHFFYFKRENEVFRRTLTISSFGTKTKDWANF